MATTLEPTPEHVDQWMKKIRGLGGTELGTCRAREFSYTIPPGRQRTAYTCGCGNDTLVKLPYFSPRQEGPQSLVLCAVCDAGTQMPRLTV